MKILHICNDYCGSKVHRNLYEKLDNSGVEQIVYTCFYDASKADRNKFESPRITFYIRPILKPYHKILYHLKIRTVYKDIQNIFDGQSYDLTHATTLFSDGAIAYQIYKNYGIPYVVVVRNTDVNSFLTLAPHTWMNGIEILKHAKKIIFISPALKSRFCKHFIIRRHLTYIQNKFVIQPNGVDDYWLQHIKTEKVKQNHDIVYVGRFHSCKNLQKLIPSVIELKKQYPSLRLHLVGGDGNKEGWVMKQIRQYPKILIYHGKIENKADLKQLYDECSVFAMPSLHETFGLVYVEALSQNLAILYSKGQGIDGLLNPKIGERVNPHSKKEIKNALVKLLDNRQFYKIHDVVDFSQFRWDVIACNYLELYKGIIR